MVVFAGCLDKDGEGAKNLRENCSERTHVLQMDITSDEQVAAAVKFIEKNLPRAGKILTSVNIMLCEKL